MPEVQMTKAPDSQDTSDIKFEQWSSQTQLSHSASDTSNIIETINNEIKKYPGGATQQMKTIYQGIQLQT